MRGGIHYIHQLRLQEYQERLERSSRCLELVRERRMALHPLLFQRFDDIARLLLQDRAVRVVVAAQERESCSDLIRLLDQVRETIRESHRLLNLIFGWDLEIRCLTSPGSESVGEVQSLYPNVVERFCAAID